MERWYSSKEKGHSVSITKKKYFYHRKNWKLVKTLSNWIMKGIHIRVSEQGVIFLTHWNYKTRIQRNALKEEGDRRGRKILHILMIIGMREESKRNQGRKLGNKGK